VRNIKIVMKIHLVSWLAEDWFTGGLSEVSEVSEVSVSVPSGEKNGISDSACSVQCPPDWNVEPI
jgi:hypothetical protein